MTLTPEQQRDIERARALVDAADHLDPAVLADEVAERTALPPPSAEHMYPVAFAVARNSIERLLAIIAALTGAP